MTHEYKNGVLEFLNFVETNLPKLYCPYVKCSNKAPIEVDIVKEHLGIFGICKSYMTWIWHGEVMKTQCSSQKEEFDVDISEPL